MGYQFKLESLRRYRQFQEEAQQKELAEANKIRDQIVNELQKKIAVRHQTEQDLKAQQGANATAPLISLYESFLMKISADIKLQRKKVIAAEKMCRQKRDGLLVAMQKKKTLERIKEKDFETYLAALEHKEAQFINELAINRFALTQK
jgi:flagellar protein FliJ